MRNGRRFCTSCQNNVVATPTGRINALGEPLFKDEDGLIWNGKVCHVCHAIAEHTEPKRYCRKCKCVLPARRYFYCLDCVQVYLPDYAEPFGSGGYSGTLPGQCVSEMTPTDAAIGAKGGEIQSQ